MSKMKKDLEFTGNWFLDAGILGFINLMEEFYGWNLDELKKRIRKEYNNVYYGYFPFAYIFKNLKHPNKNLFEMKIKEESKRLEKELKELGKGSENEKSPNTEKIFNRVWEIICKLCKDIGVINDEKDRLPLYLSACKNFLFFNSSMKNEEQRKSFYSAISFDTKSREILKKIDKTINKLLPSEKEFPNIYYTPISTEQFKSRLDKLFVYLLCFIYAFEKYEHGPKKNRDIKNVMFYSNDLKFCYTVNKRLKSCKEKSSSNQYNILRKTWEQIIDLLVEHKSIWSIENMYIISYKKLDDQEQMFVEFEYISIPKLQASIILDDNIREALNHEIQFRNEKSNVKKFCWLLEEFIKGKPLYPIILNYVNLFLNKRDKIILNKDHIKSFIYSLIVEANILDFKASRRRNLFSEDFFNYNYSSLVENIKNDIRGTSFVTSLINKISEDPEKREIIARDLLRALYMRDKNKFLYILLKNMNENKELSTNKNINDWIFNKIIKNNLSFEMYCLILIINLL